MGNEEAQVGLLRRSGVVLLNPASGASRGAKDPDTLTEWAGEFGSRVLTSSYAGELTQLAQREAEQGCPLIIAAGGDDTVREVLFGLDRAGVFDRPPEERPYLGILPLGTFNNFARYLGIPLDARQALELAHNGMPRRVDLGRANGRLFTESVGVGIDVAAWRAFPEESPSVFRRLWDGAKAVVKALTVFRPRRYYLEVDGQRSALRAFNIVVANASDFAAGLQAPQVLDMNTSRLRLFGSSDCSNQLSDRSLTAGMRCPNCRVVRRGRW